MDTPAKHADTARASHGGGLPRIQKASEKLADLLSSRWPIVVSVWLLAVALSMLGYSRQKPLGSDELLFRSVATLPSPRSIWTALTLGINTDPPLAHILTHYLTSVFGTGDAIVRLSGMFGICAMLLFLFLTLRRQIGALYALAVLAIPFCTPLTVLAYQARPYGLMYGCLAVAIYCWARIGEEDRCDSAPWNVAFGLALAAALACHFYAVFVLPASYVAEWVRALRRRRVSWGTWLAIVGATASILLYWPITADARQFSAAYFARPAWRSLPQTANALLHGLLRPLGLFLVLAAITFVSGFRFSRRARSFGEAAQFRELITLATGLLLLPLPAWIAGMLVLKAFAIRYVLHGLLGVFLILPLLAARAFRQDRTIGLALLLACGLPASIQVARGAVDNFRTPPDRQNFALVEKALKGTSGDIVVSDPHLFTQLVNYSPFLRDKCVLLLDRENERRYTHQDGISRVYRSADQLGWFRAEQWSAYPNRDKAFLFLIVPGKPDIAEWLRAYLTAEGRYGDVVMKIGRYQIVASRPAQEAQT